MDTNKRVEKLDIAHVAAGNQHVMLSEVAKRVSNASELISKATLGRRRMAIDASMEEPMPASPSPIDNGKVKGGIVFTGASLPQGI